MLRHFLLTLWLVSLVGAAQNAVAPLQDFVRNVETFNRLFPQEKVYLHLDNTGYFIGETLWYKAYVTRTAAVKDEDRSRVLYVELVDPFGEVVETQKLALTDDQAHGDFRLHRLRTAGFYEVRAYTRYMTNWDARGIFSRVVPIFQTPDREGDYAQRRIRDEFVESRQPLPDLPDTLTRKERSRWRRGELPTVRFYPEGGALVEGLTSVVAFDVAARDSVVEEARGTLLTASGDTLGSVATLADGRGVFAYTPTEERAVLALDFNGTTHRIALPSATREGVVLTVNATAARHVVAQIAATPSLYGRTLGWSLLHQGTLEAFDSLTLSSEPVVQSFARSDLSAGVHQLTLFDREGRIWAERLFFVAPDSTTDLCPIRIAAESGSAAPYAPLRLRLQAAPKSRFSLAVRDAATLTNDCQTNAATYLLLASEVQGFVRHAERYLRDDAPTRRLADLLMLTQGWRRYDWRMMAGRAPFVKRQPREDSLYIDGQLKPRELWGGGLFASKKAKARARDVGNIELRLTLYNRQGESFVGHAVTDRNGYYAFAAPDLEGDWTLLFSTRQDDKLQNYPVTINRWFSPPMRNYGFYETELLPTAAMTRAAERADTAALAATPPSDKSRLLGTAVVKRKRIYDITREAWEVTRGYADRHSQFRFDMEREVDRCIDEGQGVPTLAAWLMSKNVFARAFYGQRRTMEVVMGGRRSPAGFFLASKAAQRKFLAGETFDRDFMQDTMSVNNNISNYYFTAARQENGAPVFGGQRDAMRGAAESMSNGATDSRFPELDIYMNSPIDQVREVYVSLEAQEHFHNTGVPTLFRDHTPFHVYAYPKYRFDLPSKGFRRTAFKGFNVPHVFEMPDYSALPPSEDYRRTLYWNPDVRTDAAGNAEVSFYNNGTARDFQFSAEGIAPDGRPMLGR